MEEFEVKEEGVLKQLNELNVNKSVGPDGLSPHLLKMLAPTITPLLTTIYRQSLSLNKNPADWKTQHISPILKPGKDKTAPSSYRPVAITSICCKILEHIIYSQTMDHLQKNKILSELQHGYRNFCSTETQLLQVINYLTKGLENRTQVDCISLDFSRAFDTVPQERLLLKMQHYGIRRLIPWFRDFLFMRDQIVIVNGAKSRIVKMLSGIVQGSCTAALCFLITFIIIIIY